VYIYDYMFLSSSKNETYFRKCCRGNQNTHFVFSIFFPDNRALYEIIWKNAVQPDITQMTILGRMRIRCSITKVTHTHTEYVICNAYQLKQWLNEPASMLRYTYMACLVVYGRRHITKEYTV
jgi:hypothetical protein